MIAVLRRGKEVRGVNSGRGLEGAAFDFNSGELGSRDDPNHLHVYLGMFSGAAEFQFICSQVALTAEEVVEAAIALAESKKAKADEMLRLRAEILGPNGDELLLTSRGTSWNQIPALVTIAMGDSGHSATFCRRLLG